VWGLYLAVLIQTDRQNGHGNGTALTCDTLTHQNRILDFNGAHLLYVASIFKDTRRNEVITHASATAVRTSNYCIPAALHGNAIVVLTASAVMNCNTKLDIKIFWRKGSMYRLGSGVADVGSMYSTG